MGFKRKRNIKVDSETGYTVLFLRDLGAEQLEDYVEVHDSGMEAEEEKEIQLQKIIQEENGSIPLPVIRRVDNPIRESYGKKSLPRRIRWTRDCGNEYIEDVSVVEQLIGRVNSQEGGDGRDERTGSAAAGDKPGALDSENERDDLIIYKSIIDRDILNVRDGLDGIDLAGPVQDRLLGDTAGSAAAGAVSPPDGCDESADMRILEPIPRSIMVPSGDRLWIFLNGLSVFRRAFAVFGELKNAISNKSRILVDFVLNRVLLRYENSGFEAYACFRRRIFHPTFKSRRNEALIAEKLERMSDEFNSLGAMCDLLSTKCALETDYLNKTEKILRIVHSASLTKRQRKSYRKKLLEITEDDPKAAVAFNAHSAMLNRNKIAYLKNLKMDSDALFDAFFLNDFFSLFEQADEEAEASASEAAPAEEYKKPRFDWSDETENSLCIPDRDSDPAG